MTIKQKFSSIDQSKLTADQKAFLDKIKNVTKNFTDAEMNKKVEIPLDNFIAKAKEKMPEAIKSAPAKRTTKAKSTQTRKPKRTAMSLAKEIRKEGESWKDAQVRARKMMKEDSQSLSKTVESELDKLTKLVRSQKVKDKLVGISGTDIKRDAVRKAKPRGARKVTRSGETSNQYGTYKNHLGRKYYESRDEHSDRLAPRYPKNAPLLAEGGYLTDPTFGTFQNQVFAEGGDIDAFTLRMVKSNGIQPAEVLKEDANVKYAKGGGVRTINGREYSYGRNWTNDHNLTNKGEEHEVNYTRKKRFELGGTVVTDLAGHTGGSLGGDPTMLDGMSGTAYTGLVGETGAMSSGEMFMNGGGVDDFKIWEILYLDKGVQKSILVEGDSSIIETNNWKKQNPNKEFIQIRLYKNKMELGGGLPSGASQSYMITESLGNPAQHFAKGGGVRKVGNREYSYGRNWTNDHRHLNKAEEHEVTYNRKGKFLGIFDDGGKVGTHKYTLSEAKNILDAEKSKNEGYSWFVSDVDYYGEDDTEQEYGVHLTDKELLDLADEVGEYNKGGAVTNERRYVNKGEDYEVRYSKPILRRKGYQGKRDFMSGGAIKNQYTGRTPEDIWDSLSVEQRKHFLIDHLWANEEQIEQIQYKRLEEDDKEFVDYYAVRTWKKLSGDVRKAFTSHVKEGEYNKGGAVTNERRYVNKGEDYEVRYSKPILRRKGYQGKRDFMSGGSMETPRIYVADLEAYNNGRLSGVWLDLADYNDADELMKAIQDFLNTTGGEEYAIHDAEYIPSSMYSEYMGQKDFEELYEMMDLAKKNDLPLEVVQEVVSQFGEFRVDFQGRYDNAEDFAEQLVDEMGGLENFSSPEYYVDITDTDRRLLAGDMADSYVDDIRDEDGGNRVIEEAGLDLDEYEEADSERREEMVDEAVEIVREEYYDTWYEGLSDPYEFLVEEQGMYSPEDLFNASFIRIDYEKLARDLEQDYTFIYEDGELYVFNIR